jgi:hypothetical protein
VEQIGFSGNSGYGYVATPFTIPSGTLQSIHLSGVVNVDDTGTVILQGSCGVDTYLCSCDAAGHSNNQAFTEVNANAFCTGATNYLIVADKNSGGGPNGVALYATVQYTICP